MADTKISALAAVTTPASTDEFPVNQAGTTKKMTRAQVHNLESGEQLLLDVGAVDAPSIKFNGTAVGLYYVAGRIRLSVSDQAVWETGSAYWRDAINTNGPYIAIANSSSTAATFAPDKADTNTGLGHSTGLADNLALVCGGLEAIRAEDPADLVASETSLWLYDDDNGALQQVTVGADDSGGAGFKVLRIAN